MPTVNGYPVPAVIPPSHVTLYFPRGVLGLVRLAPSGTVVAPEGPAVESAPTAVFLTPNGSLRFDPDGQYWLPSAPRLHQAGHRRYHDDDDDSSTMVGNSEDDFNVQPLDHEPTSTAAVATGDLILGSRRRSQPPIFGVLQRMGVVQDVSTAGPQEGRSNWQRHRRRSMMQLLAFMVLSVVLAIVAAAIEYWYFCACTTGGVWQSCSTCSINSTNATAGTLVKPTCISSVSIGECQGPLYNSMQALIILAIVAIVLHIFASTVDLSFDYTPRFPFYPVIYLLGVSLSLAVWGIYTHAGTVAVFGASTQTDCTLETDFFLHYYGRSPSHATDVMQFAKDCRFGPSLWMWVVSWAVYSLAGVNYFTQRYFAWRGWSNSGNTAQRRNTVAAVLPSSTSVAVEATPALAGAAIAASVLPAIDDGAALGSTANSPIVVHTLAGDASHESATATGSPLAPQRAPKDDFHMLSPSHPAAAFAMSVAATALEAVGHLRPHHHHRQTSSLDSFDTTASNTADSRGSRRRGNSRKYASASQAREPTAAADAAAFAEVPAPDTFAGRQPACNDAAEASASVVVASIDPKSPEGVTAL